MEKRLWALWSSSHRRYKLDTPRKILKDVNDICLYLQSNRWKLCGKNNTLADTKTE